MNLRSQYDNIADSIRNGQRRQAYRQMVELDGDELANMLEYFERDLADPRLALDAARTFFRHQAHRTRGARE